MNNTTTKTRTLGIVIVLVAAAAVITGTYAATITQSAFAGKKEKQQASDESSPCSHLKAIKGGKIACASNEQKAKIDQQQSVNDGDDEDKSKDANDKGRSYDANNDEDSSDVTQSETASISQDANATASIG
jgi:hypothetical protein